MRSLLPLQELNSARSNASETVLLGQRGRAFDDFDPEKVALYSERRIQSLTSDPEIIRNRMKIEAAVRNARAFLEIQEEFGDSCTV
jgi:DNA-3-methyladenine glycosylase I